MTMRLLLALLMILSAPLAAAQHLGCVQPADEHCDSCDLACLSACASVGMPASLTDVVVAANHTTPDLPLTANLLLSHPLPLLRPPTLATA